VNPNELDEHSPIGSLHAAFTFATHQREFEINQLTQRNNFFMIFQGVLIAGLVQSQGTATAILSFAVCVLGLVISLFQVGMAAGSKYWQIRWERGAKTTEIWLLDSLKHATRVSSFLTADGLHLTKKEKNTLAEINSTPQRAADPITFGDGDTTKANRAELHIGSQDFRRQFENWLILKKFSVSRIPLWVGLVFALFWLFLLTFTVSVDASSWNPRNWFHIVALAPAK
jgi:hypothetical protein